MRQSLPEEKTEDVQTWVLRRGYFVLREVNEQHTIVLNP